MKGSVIWFDSEKGFGFIKSENDDETYFHWTSIKSNKEFRTLYPGQPVLYEIGKDQYDRPMAIEISPIERINEETGKPVYLCSFVDIGERCVNIEKIQYEVMRHAEAGLKWCYQDNSLLFCMDTKLESESVIILISNFIRMYDKEIKSKTHRGVRETYTVDGLDFDIIFL